MTCPVPACKYEFCRICGGSRFQAEAHGNHYHLATCAHYADCCAEQCTNKGRANCKDDRVHVGCPACTKLGRLCDPPR